jgi:hypothetical protein
VANAPLASVTAAHPNQDFATVTLLGLKASNLALLHEAALTPRLPPSLLASLLADLDLLGAVVPEARQIRHEARVATADQDAALRAGYARVQAVRAAVKKARAAPEVQKAYGVGQLVKPTLVRDVKAVLKQILDRATASPDEATSLGILPKDLAAITSAHQAISDADKTQTQKQASAPLSTQERNRTANRVLAAVARIAGAGGLEFADRPDVLAGFTALKPAPRKKGAPKSPAATPIVTANEEPSAPPPLLAKTG